MEKEAKKFTHRLNFMLPNPYGYMCYCRDCGRHWANFNDPKTSPCEVQYHCLYAGLCENGPTECLFPGMDGVDASCSGYAGCQQYESGSRLVCEENE